MTVRRLLLTALLSCFAGACGNPPSPGGTLYHNGVIVTMDSGDQVEAVVATADGRIGFVGTEAEARSAYPGAASVDLRGRTMMPGFIEQHLHPFLGALTLSVVVIAPEAWELPSRTWPAVDGHEAYVAALRNAVDSEEGDGVVWTWGYNQYFHGDMSRALLNEISPNRPVGVWHRSVHEFFVNDAFIAHFDIRQEDVDALGEEVAAQVDLDRGYFFEAGALLYLLPRIFPDLGNDERFSAGLRQMVEMLHGTGVTTFVEPGAFIPDYAVPTYEEILGAPSSPMNAFFIPEAKTPYFAVGAEGVLEAVESATATFADAGKVRFLPGQVKLLIDGAIVSQLMQMTDGYTDGHHGEWIQPPEDIEVLTKIFWEEGYQIHVHVNGDLGMEELLAIMERRQREFPREDHRFTVVHFANSTDAQVQRIADLGGLVSANPYYVTGFAERFGEIGLGPERAHAMVRLGTAERLGVPVSLHSDMPIGPGDPLFLAWSAVTRSSPSGEVYRPDLALSPEAALRGITIEAARSVRLEDEIGSIAQGKEANFTILDRNPLDTPIDEWLSIQVLETVYRGESFPVR